MVLNQNLTAASSRINDIDWAKRLTDLARFGIIGQAGAANTQANVPPQSHPALGFEADLASNAHCRRLL